MKDHDCVVLSGNMRAPSSFPACTGFETLKASESLIGAKAILLPYFMQCFNIPFGGMFSHAFF